MELNQIKNMVVTTKHLSDLTAYIIMPLYRVQSLSNAWTKAWDNWWV
jgi:hypothetical protein